MIRVAIAEDSPFYRRGLINFLKSQKQFQICGEYENGQLLIDDVLEAKPDVVLLDLRMPVMNGYETAVVLNRNLPTLRILFLSLHSGDEFVEKALRSGAHGYLSKDDEPKEVAAAIREVHEKGFYLNERTSKVLVTKLAQDGILNSSVSQEVIPFTLMEKLVTYYTMQELTIKEISTLVNRSERAVESCRKKLMEKLECKSAVGIVVYAIKNSILEGFDPKLALVNLGD